MLQEALQDEAENETKVAALAVRDGVRRAQTIDSDKFSAKETVVSINVTVAIRHGVWQTLTAMTVGIAVSASNPLVWGAESRGGPNNLGHILSCKG